MFPVKDDLRTPHAAVLAALLAGAVVALALAGLAPADPLTIAVLAAGAAIFGPSLFAGVPVLAVSLTLIPGAFAVLSASPRDALAAALAALVAGSLVLAPRARILSLAIVPFYFTLVAVPAWIWAAVWALLVALASPALITALAGGALAGTLLCCATRPLRRARAIEYR